MDPRYPYPSAPTPPSSYPAIHNNAPSTTQQEPLYADDPSNPFVQQPVAAGSDNPFLAPQLWQQQQAPQYQQPTYPFVAQGTMSDAVQTQGHRDTTGGSPVSSTSSGIPASHGGGSSYPVISSASLGKKPKPQPIFPDIQLSKDVAATVLAAPPVAVMPEPARPGVFAFSVCLVLLPHVYAC